MTGRCWRSKLQRSRVFNSEFQTFNKRLLTESHICRTRRRNSDGVCLQPPDVARPDPAALLAEASLSARQFTDQLPELGEGQLAVVVLVYGAHELVDHAGVTGVLGAGSEKRQGSGCRIPAGRKESSAPYWLTEVLHTSKVK